MSPRVAARTLRALLPVALLGAGATAQAATAQAAIAAPVTAAQTAAEAPEFAVSVVTANGSGCPDATATVRMLPDGSSFAIDFDGYVAWTGGGAPVTSFRRNCQFNLQITRPDGLTYAVEQAEYAGYALLDDGVSGIQAARYYFQGDSATTVGSHPFTGPLADAWETTDTFGPQSLRFAPCDTERNLNVNTELRLRPQPASASPSLLVMDSTITLRLAWRTCP